ncbi:MAG: flagellar basal-body rod protein FlgF [Sulfuritalea sp.]|nr:flagellar basal-body rod protein FlgF [Sulfuritalea sp.]
MDRLIYTAMTGASQTLNRQAAVAHNLANVSSTGYRAEEHRLRAVQVQSNAQQKGLATRAFAVDASTHTDYTPGPMMITGRPLDMAVQGAGWIAVQLADGSEAYTRNGSFEINVNGILQTRNGLPVQGDGGPIAIPPDVKISVGVDGTISVLPESGAQNTVSVIGRVKLVNPPETDLVRGEDGLFRLRDRSAAAIDERVKVAAGTLEGSNVNPAEQMVTMISLARQFEMQMKMLSAADANDRAATQILSSR